MTRSPYFWRIFLMSGAVWLVCFGNILMLSLLFVGLDNAPPFIFIPIIAPPAILLGEFVFDQPMGASPFLLFLFWVITFCLWPTIFAVITFFLLKRREKKVRHH